ncbi:MAG: hypothetical protein AABX88_00465 [Nanoarchaeota archaeon]
MKKLIEQMAKYYSIVWDITLNTIEFDYIYDEVAGTVSNKKKINDAPDYSRMHYMKNELHDWENDGVQFKSEKNSWENQSTPFNGKYN